MEDRLRHHPTHTPPDRTGTPRAAGPAVRGRHAHTTLLLLGIIIAGNALAFDTESERQAMAFSQAAIGTPIPDMQFTDSNGGPRKLAAFHGKPLIVSMVFSACTYSCSVTTRHIARVVQEARRALGEDSFTVVTIGFDIPVDTPEAMRAFAVRHAVAGLAGWHFLSGDDPTAMTQLMAKLGMTSVPSPRGFDHTVQLSIIDGDGVLYRQVYGETFSTPLLVEPLKDLILGRPASDDGLYDRLQKRVRLFCTVYDARSDSYYFDYSLFIGIMVGVLFIGGMSLWLWREIRYARRRRAT